MLSFLGWGSSPNPDSKGPNSQEKTPSDQSNAQSQSSPAAPQQPTQQAQPPSPENTQNLKLLFGGMAFFALSIWITRRAHIKKRIDCIPPFYTSSTYHNPTANGAAEAFEALNLATINVLSFGMMTSGGVLYALDINSLEDARRIMRAGLEGGSASKSDEELENEVTEWVSSVLGERFQKQLERERAKKQLESGSAEKGN